MDAETVGAPTASRVSPSARCTITTTSADELAVRHRASIERFYDCGDEMHRCLAEIYLADDRFTR